MPDSRIGHSCFTVFIMPSDQKLLDAAWCLVKTMDETANEEE